MINDFQVEKCALLMIAIGEEAASEVMRCLPAKETQRLAQAMTKVETITRENLDNVLVEFRDRHEAIAPIGVETNEYVQNMLRKALGEERAGILLNRISTGANVSGIENLKWLDAPSVADLVRNEHPQIVAAILAHLEPDHAANILSFLPERLQSEAMLRLARLDGIQPAALEDLNNALSRLLEGRSGGKSATMGGAKTAAEILNLLPASSEEVIIGSIREFDGELAEKIVDEMFTFEDLTQIDDRGMQSLLREIQTETLVTALKASSEELKAKVFKNMSSRAAEALKEDLESRGPMRLSEVEEQQKEILKVARRLIEEGQVTVVGLGGSDQMV